MLSGCWVPGNDVVQFDRDSRCTFALVNIDRGTAQKTRAAVWPGWSVTILESFLDQEAFSGIDRDQEPGRLASGMPPLPATIGVLGAVIVIGLSPSCLETLVRISRGAARLSDWAQQSLHPNEIYSSGEVSPCQYIFRIK